MPKFLGILRDRSKGLHIYCKDFILCFRFRLFVGLGIADRNLGLRVLLCVDSTTRYHVFSVIDVCLFVASHNVSYLRISLEHLRVLRMEIYASIMNLWFS